VHLADVGLFTEQHAAMIIKKGKLPRTIVQDEKGFTKEYTNITQRVLEYDTRKKGNREGKEKFSTLFIWRIEMVKRRTTKRVLNYAIFLQYGRDVSVCKTTFYTFFCGKIIIL
jgi:hypothetical protein